MSKPREFWIRKDSSNIDGVFYAWNEKRATPNDCIKVIEKQAYDEACDRRDWLQKEHNKLMDASIKLKAKADKLAEAVQEYFIDDSIENAQALSMSLKQYRGEIDV